MKRLFLVLLAAVVLLQLACYKDKGNYDYDMPVVPKISGLDSVHYVFLGEMLQIKPVITSTYANPRYGYTWRISIPKEFRDTVFQGPELSMRFLLDAERYNARLTIIDSLNDMKYFHDFIIAGKTEFTTGTLVLSKEGATAQLSFVKPDSTVIPRVYRELHGVDLPGGPQQIVPMVHTGLLNKPTFNYWITGTETNDAGVQVSPGSLKRIRSLRENFFDPVPSAVPGVLESRADGAPHGVVNGKLYVGAWKTYYGDDLFGMFSAPTMGDYELHRQVAINTSGMPVMIGYEKNRKQIVAFTNFGDPAYIGAGYQVAGAAFDPKNVALDLLHFQQIKNGDYFAFGKGADGIVHELKFTVAFMGFIQIKPEHKRPFPQQALITPDTKWHGADGNIFYFTSGDKIYRYNPLNEEIRPLVTDFGGKAVSMVKVIEDGKKIIAGTEGSLYLLDLDAGKLGVVLKKYDGIPGAPVDAIIKN